MPEYRWMTLKAVEKAVPAMEAEDVSEVARGDTPSTVTKEGFVEAYRATKGSPAKMKKRPATTGTSWAKRRQEFIGRHMGQIRENGEPLFRDGGIPTRRHLGLIAWAYTPLKPSHGFASGTTLALPPGPRKPAATPPK